MLTGTEPPGGGQVTGPPTGDGAPTPGAFFAEWLSETFAEKPAMASALGLVEYDGELGDFSEEAFDRRARSARRWAVRLAELGWAGPPTGTSAGGNTGPRARAAPPPGALTEDDRIDAALLASHLAGDEVMSEWQFWQRDPDAYLDPCLWGISTLFTQRLRPEAELVEAAVSRLKQVAGVLERAWSQLDPELASPIVLEHGIAAAHGGVEFFTESLPAAIASPELREVVAAPAEEASVALRRFADRLSELAGSASGSFAIGEERYSALLKQRELLSLDAAQLHALGQRAWADLDAEMTELANRVAGIGAGDGAAGWRSVVTALFSDHPGNPEELVTAYAEACWRARSFLVEHELVTLPEGERCWVEPSPEFLRPVIAVASYQEPPPFAVGNEGHFFVPFPPSGARPWKWNSSWPTMHGPPYQPSQSTRRTLGTTGS